MGPKTEGLEEWAGGGARRCSELAVGVAMEEVGGGGGGPLRAGWNQQNPSPDGVVEAAKGSPETGARANPNGGGQTSLDAGGGQTNPDGGDQWKFSSDGGRMKAWNPGCCGNGG